MKLNQAIKQVITEAIDSLDKDILNIFKSNPNYRSVHGDYVDGIFAEFLKDGKQVARVIVRVKELKKVEFTVEATDRKWSSTAMYGPKSTSRTVTFDSITDPGFISAVKNPLSIISGKNHSFLGATVEKVISHGGGHGYDSISVILKLKDGSTISGKIELSPEDEK